LRERRGLASGTAARLTAGRPALLALLVAVLLAAGCGSSSNNPTTSATGPRLSKKQFIKRADTVCGRWNARNSVLQQQAEPVTNPFGKGVTDSQRRRLAGILHRYAANVRQEADQLAKLRPPADVESDWNDTISRIHDFADAIDDAANALSNNDSSSYLSSVKRAQSKSLATDTFVSRYGFAVCGAHS
jgi:hypothetical protein